MYTTRCIALALALAGCAGGPFVLDDGWSTEPATPDAAAPEIEVAAATLEAAAEADSAEAETAAQSTVVEAATFDATASPACGQPQAAAPCGGQLLAIPSAYCLLDTASGESLSLWMPVACRCVATSYTCACLLADPSYNPCLHHGSGFFVSCVDGTISGSQTPAVDVTCR